MSQLLRFGGNSGSRALPVRFERKELNRLFALYSGRVAQGEWRDYAIALQPNMAVFAIFRSSLAPPIYTITKRDGGKRPYEVASGKRKLTSADTLEEALAVFDRELRLVH